MVTDIVNNYRMLQRNLDKLIDSSGYRLGFITDKMGMDRTSFYYKRKNMKFSIDEIEKLLDIIKADELEDKVLIQLSNEAKLRNDFVVL